MNLKENEIHLWHIDQSDFDLPELQENRLDWLSKTELARFNRYLFDRHRKQLLLGKILVRSVLSRYDETVQPKDWNFTQNDYGKPAIDPAQQKRPLFFNISHSGDKLVLAVASSEFIGVDIEQCCKPRRVSKISSRYFSTKEAAELLAMPEQSQLSRFYQLWTLKEAYIKACGLGLAIPLQHFSYSFPGNERLVIEFNTAREDDPKSWQLWQLSVNKGYKLALALKTSNASAQNYNISSWQVTDLNEVKRIDSTILRKS
ncbi:MAG: hypothetical protein COA96_11370 [SAR86 cluster bacterium]|uniref:Uncharacterized protein n=1 Tax=SAR86 cluster bacterium TaxID=2030880 RepID=A0A2A5AX11_9GAMM|nr:MAG: hypothetical protein COA96_11370 [SAR86 cluster bacterium]